MEAFSPEIRCRELGAFLRAHRERLSPALAGLPPGSRRRTPGLRREEVAQLCGFSATWYSWIEQGRPVAASPAALGRLAEALHLSPAERGYLFELAGKRDPTNASAVGDEPRPAVLAALRSIGTPAYLLDRRWSALAWTTPAERLFTGWLDGEGDRNLLRYTFLSPDARALLCDWEERARRVAAEFRADYSRRPDDPLLRGLIEELTAASPVFARYWGEQAVLSREGGERQFNHPQDGLLRYQQAVFTLADRPDIKMVVLTPLA